MKNVWLALMLAAATVPASGQAVQGGQGAPGAQAAQGEVTDPLQCWWRTTAGAVKVGDQFTLVLTCSVVETEAVKVVPDQSTLDATVLQLPPFEVIGGSHPADLRTGDRRFFQYEYRMRIIADDAFGHDVKVPETKITYRVQSQVGNGGANQALEGREQTYILPGISIRILSTVPGDATDIRDTTSAETFADVDARRFRANLLITIASVLFALAGVTLVVALIRAISKRLAPSTHTKQPLADAAILRGAARELRAIQRERRSGWTPALINRIATVLRIAASYALAHRVGQTEVALGVGPRDGQILIRGGWTRGTRVLVSGSMTGTAISQALTRAAADGSLSPRRVALLETLVEPLRQLTLAQYGSNAVIDEQMLDQGVDAAGRVVRKLAIEHTWLYRKLAAVGKTGANFTQRVWSR